MPRTDTDAAARGLCLTIRHARAQRGDTSGGGRLAKYPLELGDLAVGFEDRLVGDRAEGASGLARCRHGRVPAGRASDADRAVNRLGVLNGDTMDERRGASRLSSDDPRKARLIPA